ncbi:DUF5064 family protein [Pseudomonas sp. L-22-4S-12]|uniref:DUF5064 family protein n=1 Tax=Pseudomonas sp. L-22-4S-12 TaxID=2610893 RepID=UPI00132AC6D3|nr:DUF5064 family protein [Pseudomonas sp. L-22-4S-12]MWV15943.1 DUF5064 family protein [Pseudomonas sp. L-22-4S-12]
MFQPGHLHRSHLPGQLQFAIDLFYEVRQDPKEGAMLHFRMVGEIEGKAFCEEFDLHRDTAFNFASVLMRVAAKHGLPTSHNLIMHGHDEYDRMYQDIRDKLGAHPGDPVNFDHLAKDGF